MTRKDADTDLVLQGIAASPGICIGKAYLVDREGVEVIPKYCLLEKHVKGEVKRFKTAVQAARAHLLAVIENSPEPLQKARILDTHVHLLQDKMLYGRTIETIERERVNAEWALKTVVNGLKGAFEEMPDSYLRERVSDIVHVSELILQRLTGNEAHDIAAIDRRVILVARDLSPAETSQINLERIQGIVTDLGGKTSHTGIVARTLEIPAVVGLEQASRRIRTDDLIIVDGTRGMVIVNPTEETLAAYEEQKSLYERRRAGIAREAGREAVTRDGHRYRVLGNIELPEEVVAVINYGGDGIGLYRTEFQYMNREDFPSERELLESYRDVIEVMAPRPVIIRTLDINGDKALRPGGGDEEPNPALGLRAIRYCLKRPEVFRIQLRAILRAAVHGEVRLLFPMVSTYFEIREAKRLLQEAARSLARERIPHRGDIPVGAMIEVPSAVIIADHLAEEVDFFSIGTNDLIQYTLAVDRMNEKVAYMYEPYHLSVLRLIKHIVVSVRACKKPVAMCGEMASDMTFTKILIGIGLNDFSVPPALVLPLKKLIRGLSMAEATELEREVFGMGDRDAVEELLKNDRMRNPIP